MRTFHFFGRNIELREHRFILRKGEKNELYLDLLLLEDNGVKAVCVITDEGDGVCELKNIAVVPDAQRQGYGKNLISYLINHYLGVYAKMIVGTGDVPSALGFYESCGFSYSHRIENFFTDNYNHAMIEDGILLKDMVYLSRKVFAIP